MEIHFNLWPEFMSAWVKNVNLLHRPMKSPIIDPPIQIFHPTLHSIKAKTPKSLCALIVFYGTVWGWPLSVSFSTHYLSGWEGGWPSSLGKKSLKLLFYCAFDARNSIAIEVAKEASALNPSPEIFTTFAP